MLRALTGDVTPAAVGLVTARPLQEAGLDPLVPDRYRLGALVRAVAEHLTRTGIRDLPTDGGLLQVRGQSASLDGRPLSLSPAPMAMLRMLARRPGEVVSRDRLLAVLPGAGDAHAVEVAIGRVRAALGTPDVVKTVVKRGYRLALASPALERAEPDGEPEESPTVLTLP